MPNVLIYNKSSNTIEQASILKTDELLEYLCVEYLSNTTYAGSLSIGTSNPIGTFTDTAREGTVGSNVTTIVSNIYTLSHVNTAALSYLSDPPHGCILEQTGSDTVIKESNTFITLLVDDLISFRSSVRTGGYYLANTAPVDGGTWVSRGVLKDTLENLTFTVTDYHLWQKISSGSAVLHRPLKLVSNVVQEFSNEDINGVLKKLEERIVSTGIGTYSLGASPPPSGTWVVRGTAIVDTRRTLDSQVTEATYTAEYATSYDVSVYTSQTGGDAFYTGQEVTGFSTFTSTFNLELSYTVNGYFDTNFQGPGVSWGTSYPSYYSGTTRAFLSGVFQRRTPGGTVFNYTRENYQGQFFAGGGPTNWWTSFPQYAGTYTLDAVYTGPVLYYTADYQNSVLSDVEYTGSTVVTNYYTGDISFYVSNYFQAGYTASSSENIVSSNTETITSVSLYERTG